MISLVVIKQTLGNDEYTHTDFTLFDSIFYVYPTYPDLCVYTPLWFGIFQPHLIYEEFELHFVVLHNILSFTLHHFYEFTLVRKAACILFRRGWAQDSDPRV